MSYSSHPKKGKGEEGEGSRKGRRGDGKKKVSVGW